MKKTVIIIFSIILLLDIGFVFGKKEDYSELENRYLMDEPSFSFSKLFDGKYIKDLEEYLKDHFIFRDIFVSLNSRTNKLELKKEINGIYLAKDNYLIERYNGNYKKEKIVKVFNNLYSKLNYVNMELMLVPTSITVNNDLLPSFVETNQLNDIKYIESNINFHSIDLYDTLNNNNENYPMFYKTDHHFTSYAAYYSYVEYCKSNGIKYYDITDFKIDEVTDKFLGTIYSKVLLDKNYDSIYKFSLPSSKFKLEYNNKLFDSLYDESYLDVKDKYNYFLGGNRAFTTITNSNIKNKSLLVIKDSYANTFIPFVANHFNKVYVIDPRYYIGTISDFVRQNNINDIIIMYNANTISTDTGIIKIK